MDMRKQMMKVGMIISLGNGLVLGSLFSAIGMANSPSGIIPMGVVTSALLSAVISIIIGLIVPMGLVSQKVTTKLGINPARQKFLGVLVEGIVGDLIFTPILCTFFVVKNFMQGLIPPQVPKFPFWLKELGLDLLVALPVTMIIVPLLRKLAFKMFHIGEERGEDLPDGEPAD